MFDRFSEAACLLVGIDPELSEYSRQEGFMWRFLPGTLSNYGYEKPPADDAGWKDLEEHILFDLYRVAGLAPLGAHRVGVIIAHALERGVEIPWLETAMSDPGCTDRLPKAVLKNLGGRSVANGDRNDYRQSSKEKAKKRWEGDYKKQLREGAGRKKFNELCANGFKGCKFKSSGKINKTAIATKVMEAIEECSKDEPDGQPSFEIVKRDVWQWYDEKRKK